MAPPPLILEMPTTSQSLTHTELRSHDYVHWFESWL